MKIPCSAACVLWFLTILTSSAVAQAIHQDPKQELRIPGERSPLRQ